MIQPYYINDNYRVVATDSRNWELEKRVTMTNQTTGEEYEAWQSKGYFQTIAGLCVSWAQREARESDEELPIALALVIARLQEVTKELTELLQGV